MPMDIMLNPILADEPPTHVDKMESIFMKSEQIKNVKSMNIDEKEIMDSINKQNLRKKNDNDEAEIVIDDMDLIPRGESKPAGFSMVSDSTQSAINVPTTTSTTSTTPTPEKLE